MIPVERIRFDVLTLFPEIFSGYLTQSLLKKAIDAGLVTIRLWNFRDWAGGKHKSVDDRPFGGGPGMVIMPGPVFAAVEAAEADDVEPPLRVMLSPAGERLTQSVVRELATHPRLLLLCGRYEGFDERIRLGLRPRVLSIGDFVCNGGEVPAMTVIDTVIRLIPGVLGDDESAVDESHSEPGRLEYPQYTRPRVFRGMTVPDILLSGNHPAIAAWRREQSAYRRSIINSVDTPLSRDVSHEEPHSGPSREARSRKFECPDQEAGRIDEDRGDASCSGLSGR